MDQPCSTFSWPISNTDIEGPTRKPRHARVFSMHSDTQPVPEFPCIRMIKGICFDTQANCFTHRHAVYQCLKKPPTFFRHARVSKTRAFRHARVRFLNARFRPSKARHSRAGSGCANWMRGLTARRGWPKELVVTAVMTLYDILCSFLVVKSEGEMTHPKKTTHPNKNTVCAKNFGTVCTNCPPFPLEQAENKQKEFAQTVCANCFYSGGCFLGGLPPFEKAPDPFCSRKFPLNFP